MGMFDTIENELYCPFCGTKQKTNDFQTKDFRKAMTSLDIYEIKGINYRIYGTCYHCDNWVELHIGPDGVTQSNSYVQGGNDVKKNNTAKIQHHICDSSHSNTVVYIFYSNCILLYS